MDEDQPIVSTKSLQTPYGEQDENGTDLSLIRWMLSLTPEQRLLEGDRARRNTLRMMEYGRRARQERSASDH
ncbi:MAG TPA: hypothetical protein VG269_07805 [Tepidisphaeraceae bacterium]|jgi:hypothetical protein|nr:hypothetical protein [Tepidisphaeraceae bacterium]